jgi:integrase
MSARHEILGGLVQLYKRGGKYWHCSASIKGQQQRATTDEEELPQAKQFAEEWYLRLRGLAAAGLLKKKEKTFNEAADEFEKEYEIMTEGQRSPRWVQGHKDRLRVHLRPFLGNLGLSEVNNAAKAQEYRIQRVQPKPDADPDKPFKRPSRNTLHNEVVTWRLVLKTALRKGWIDHVADLSDPYRKQTKIVHRPWFSPAEYKQLYTATRAHKENARPQDQWDADQLHDFVLFMANTGLRPDEAMHLEHRDVEIVFDDATEQEILAIEVRGKRGVGFCKSTPMAVEPYRRLLNRPKPPTYEDHEKIRPLSRAERKAWLEQRKTQLPQPTDKLFPRNHITIFNNVLDKNKLKLDREGNKRTAYSLRHTYICMRLIEGADIYAIAKNCRTSVEMIQKHYAAHIKELLDTTKINTMKRSTKNKRSRKAPLALELQDI